MRRRKLAALASPLRQKRQSMCSFPRLVGRLARPARRGGGGVSVCLGRRILSAEYELIIEIQSSGWTYIPQEREGFVL